MNLLKLVMIVTTFFSLTQAAVHETLPGPDSSTTVGDSVMGLQLQQQRLPRTLSVQIETVPAAATVLLDDSIRGSTPTTIEDVLPGRHTLVFRKNGYYQKKVVVVIDSAANPKFVFTLLAPGSIVVSTNPEGARITLNGVSKGISPLKIAPVKPDTYTVIIEQEHYETVNRVITIGSGEHDTITAALAESAAYREMVQKEQAQMVAHRRMFTRRFVAAAFGLFLLSLAIIEVRQ